MGGSLSIKMGVDGQEATIGEVNVYKYLGVKIGNNRTFGYICEGTNMG